MHLHEFFDELIEYKRACGASEKTIKEYKIHLGGTLSHSVSEIDLSELKQTDIAKVLEAGRRHGQFGPQRGAVVFRQLLRYIKESGHQLAFDWRDISIPTVPHKKVDWLDKEELDAVRDAFDLNTMSGLRDRALIEILHVTGMRISEALSLNRDDINWPKKEAEVTNGKTRDREMIYFNDESLHWLKKYLDMRNDKFPALFVSYNGNRATPCSVRRTIHNAVKAAGITKRIHPHLFRSTFGTELLRAGVDIKSVQYLMRHKSERTTLKHYIAVTKERCKDMHQKVMGNSAITMVSLDHNVAL
jgi:site-specific recombinase XerD